VAYGAGLRVFEIVALKVSDIDSKLMTLRVDQGKRQKIASLCSRRNRSSCCAMGGGRRARGLGCFRIKTRESYERSAVPSRPRLVKMPLSVARPGHNVSSRSLKDLLVSAK
jgi:integrase